MKKIFKLLAIMFAFAMQSTTTWAAADTGTNVSLHYYPSAWLGNNPKPSRAPAKFSIPLTVLLDEDNQQLKITSQVASEYTYYIYSEYGDVISQGVLYCENNESYNIDLGLSQNGSYSIVFMYNGYSFVGTFDI